MSLVRVLRTAQVVLSHVFYVDETATAPTGTLTATVKRLDGTEIVGSPFTYVVTGTKCEFTLPGQANLDSLTVDWAGTVAGAVVSARDYIEIVGGFLFGLAEARAQPKPLDALRYPAATLASKRIEVEQECERICRTAFVPRFARVAVPGSGRSTLATPHADLRVLRAVSVDGVAWSAPTVAAVGVSASGVLTLPGGGIWPSAGWVPGSPQPNIVLEYEYGRDYPPEEIRTASMIRLRSRLTATDTGVPYNALSFSVADGGVYRLSTPSAERTGIPDVDGVYARYGQDLGGFA